MLKENLKNVQNNIKKACERVGRKPEEVYVSYITTNQEVLWTGRVIVVYCNRILMYHRIHDGSETSAILGDSARGNEDFQMFCKFWPKPIARLLTRAYSSSEKSNELENK